VEEAAPPVAGNRLTLVRVNAATQLVGGTLLALDRWPRLAAAALSLTLVPASLGGDRFWEHDVCLPEPREPGSQNEPGSCIAKARSASVRHFFGV
jgi:uncharacterized membrane protein YphA (DoxX/SURF4 family)